MENYRFFKYSDEEGLSIYKKYQGKYRNKFADYNKLKKELSDEEIFNNIRKFIISKDGVKIRILFNHSSVLEDLILQIYHYNNSNLGIMSINIGIGISPKIVSYIIEEFPISIFIDDSFIKFKNFIKELKDSADFFYSSLSSECLLKIELAGDL